MTTRVSFKGRTGGDVTGELATPPGTAKAPAVVLIQEWWGINEHIKSLADRLGKDGFLVVSPDLYHGEIARDTEEAGRLMKHLDMNAAMNDIAGSVAFLKEHARSNGKVAVIGFCMGGALSFAAACHVEGLSAVVPFYGTPPADKVDYAKVTAPILAHFAKNDDWATVANAEEIKKAVEGHGKSMELQVYDAGHAFMNDSRKEAFEPKSAKLAWERTVAFLKKHLS